MNDDSATLNAYSQSWISQTATVLCFLILIPAILFFQIPAVWGLPAFLLAVAMSLVLYGMHISFDEQNRQVRVTRAWFYFLRTASFTCDFKDVQSIEILRNDPANDEIELKMLHRTYMITGWFDVDQFFLKLCQIFPQFSPPESRIPLASISEPFRSE